MGRRIPALCAALLMTVCGCGAADDGAPSRALVSWIGEFCTSNAPLLRMPDLADIPQRATEADRKPLEDYLAKVSVTLLKGKGAVTKLRPAPTAAGRTMVSRELKDLDTAISEATHYAGEAVTVSADGLREAYLFADVAAAPWDPGDPGITNYLKGHPDLIAAYRKAPACATHRQRTKKYLR